MSASPQFLVLGVNVTAADWDGSPTTLAWHESAAMPQTVDGSMIVAWLNIAEQNNDGTLAMSSAAGQPEFHDAPAGTTVPSTIARNWKGQNLKLTNVSGNNTTPISVQAYGPGLPGTTQALLKARAEPLSMAPGFTAKVRAPPRLTQLIMQADSGDLAIVALLGGPPDSSGNNAFIFGINFADPKPDIYTSVTTGNTATFSFRWTTRIFVVNLSPSNSEPVQVSLLPL